MHKREQVKSEWDSPHGLIIELPKGFHLHFEFTDEVDLLFHELPQDRRHPQFNKHSAAPQQNRGRF